MTTPIGKRSIVIRRDNPALRPVRGIVVGQFIISERDLDGLQYTPVEEGTYMVVIWHNRKRMRIESVADLLKVGEVEQP
jgi:hypothetical protein